MTLDEIFARFNLGQGIGDAPPPPAAAPPSAAPSGAAPSAAPSVGAPGGGSNSNNDDGFSWFNRLLKIGSFAPTAASAAPAVPDTGPGSPNWVNYNDWYDSQLKNIDNSKYTGADDPAFHRLLAGNALGLPGGFNPGSVSPDSLIHSMNGTQTGDPLGDLPYDLSPDDVLNYFQQQGGWESQPNPDSLGGPWSQALDFGGMLAKFGAIGLGGPIGGPIAAANISGASDDWGIPKPLQVGAQALGTLYGAPGGGTGAGNAGEGASYLSSGNTAYDVAANAGGMIPGVPSWLQGPAKSLGLNFLTSGGDLKAAAKGAAISAGTPYAADFAAPHVNDVFNGGNDGGNQPDFRRMQLADAGGMLDVPQGLMPPGGVEDFATPEMLQAGQKTLNSLPAAPGTAEDFATPEMTQAGQKVLNGLPPAPASASAAPTTPKPVTSEDLQRYAKVLLQVEGVTGDDSTGGSGATKGPVAPAADASPEEKQQYYNDIVNYLGLDAQTMADAGLQPGSPEYMDYILNQADTIISQVLDGMDVNSADLATQLHTKTAQELQQLQRALYVRGQLGQQMGAGTYVDPISGTPQQVIGSGTFDPSTAAYQRGVAGNVDTLAGKHGQSAYDYLQGMLGRHGDAFGMQKSADDRFQQALQEQNPDDEQRRRGMLNY